MLHAGNRLKSFTKTFDRSHGHHSEIDTNTMFKSECACTKHETTVAIVIQHTGEILDHTIVVS